MRRRAFSHVLLAAAVTSPALAHDFWLEPSTYRPAPGSTVEVRLRVGDTLPGEAVPRDPQRIERFVAARAAGEVEVAGLPGAEPAGLVRVEREGAVVLGYRSRRAAVELPAEKIEAYHVEEGLERVVEARARRGESTAPGREVFSRCAKSLLAAGGGPAEGFDRPLGFTLELVPEADPAALAAPATLPLRILFEGRPLEGALVEARPLTGDASPQDVAAGPVPAAGADRSSAAARSNANGAVRLALDRPGPWLVSAVHMIEAPPDIDADWESLWASLTFELPAR